LWPRGHPARNLISSSDCFRSSFRSNQIRCLPVPRPPKWPSSADIFVFCLQLCRLLGTARSGSIYLSMSEPQSRRNLAPVWKLPSTLQSCCIMLVCWTPWTKYQGIQRVSGLPSDDLRLLLKLLPYRKSQFKRQETRLFRE